MGVAWNDPDPEFIADLQGDLARTRETIRQAENARFIVDAQRRDEYVAGYRRDEDEIVAILKAEGFDEVTE